MFIFAVMNRYFLKLAFKGTHYHGWQIQPNAISIQEVLEKSLSVLLKQPITIVAAGRTDAGVHAQLMYAHFDVLENLDSQFLTQKLNSFLPKDIVIFDIIKTHLEAHARFDATSRTYQYHINSIKDPFSEELSWYFNQKLNLEKMNEAASILLQYNDFECFSKIHTDVKTFNCKITEANFTQTKNGFIFTISADRFLRNMVRAIVGTLVNVGQNKCNLEEIHQIIQSKNRNKAGFSVPAHGLFLTDIQYPYLK
jgi:tRNA pseudouridine38-40 synthase